MEKTFLKHKRLRQGSVQSNFSSDLYSGSRMIFILAFLKLSKTNGSTTPCYDFETLRENGAHEMFDNAPKSLHFLHSAANESRSL
jgi:hypothetical protein